MAGTRLTQTSFSRGELAPALYMRTEIEQYSLGSKEIKNGFIHQEGCVSNRSGLEFVGEVKNSSNETRLLEFCFNSEQTYVIEAGNYYFRFIHDGGYILDNNNAIYEIATPYKKEDLAELQTVQSADVLTITHRNYAPRELIRYAHSNWVLSPIVIEPNISPPTGVTVAWSTTTPTSHKRDYTYLVTAVEADTLEESKRSETVTATGHQESSWTTSEYFTITWLPIEGACEYNVYKEVNGIFGYIGTAQEVDDCYKIFDGKYKNPTTAVDEHGNTVYQITLINDDSTNLYTNQALAVDNLFYTDVNLTNYYGKCSAISTTNKTITLVVRGGQFIDDKIEPDMSNAAPIFQNPFEDDNYPTCCTYFQQRKIYANSKDKPQTFWASQLAASNNFNISRPLVASDAITQALADREVNEIRHLVGLNHLIALTSNTEYRINGNDGIFEANPSPIALVQSNYGSSYVKPIISGNMIIFVQSGGSVIRDLGYDYLTDSYNGSELSLFASHLFEGKTVKYMAYAKEPYRIIWIVFSNGTCASLTYNKTQKICGWTRIITDGFFESVTAVREGQEDTVYFIVKRYINPVYQGSYEFIESKTNSSNVMVYSYTCGENTYYCNKPIEIGVTVYSNNSLTTSVGVVNVLNKEENDITIGGTLKRYVERTKTRVVKKAQDGFFVDSGLSGTFNNEVTSISGLNHLAGKKVIAICNGGIITHLSVNSSGVVQLPFGVKEITIGLPFEFKLETLNIEGENTQGLKKIINSVCVNTLNSREEFFIGGSEGKYVQTDRSIESVNDSNKLFTNSVTATPLNSATPNATITIMQNKPLPLTLLSLSATFSMEDISDVQ